MSTSPVEAKYPLAFRQEEARKLGEHLRLRHSVEIVGAKRVGISDFLRFFLFRHGIVQKYIDRRQFHLFIAVDLNDLVERDVYPFWILTFKRIVDATEKFDVEERLIKEVNSLFLESIQSQDIFLTIESIRRALVKISEKNILPTIFFIRFDRIVDVVSSEFFANLEGLVAACGGRLSYVFTSFRTIDEITPDKLDRNFLHVFSNIIYLKPLEASDAKIVFNAFRKKYRISGNYFRELHKLCGGHVQYLHLSIITLSQRLNGSRARNGDLLSILASDERVNLQSEEIWESLSEIEKEVISKIHAKEGLSQSEKKETDYLWRTGIIVDDKIFSPLLERYLIKKSKEEDLGEVLDFTKKENELFKFLFENLDAVCEREAIIESVWPETEELGVSDWTIDRLVARLREKLKKQKSRYLVITVKTRGFKLATI